MFERHTPDFSQRLANIGANSDSIVLTCGHICADGGYFVYLFDSLANDTNYIAHAAVPTHVQELLESEIRKHSFEIPHLYIDPSVTRIRPKCPIRIRSMNCQHVHLSSPIQSFQCYDKSSGKVHGLTDSFWTSLILSAAAFNPTLPRAGVATCVDLRPFLSDQSKVDWSLGLNYSNVNVAAPMSMSQTVGELAREMRKDFNFKIDSGYHFAFLNTLTRAPPGDLLPGVGLELSNIGQLRLKDPIVDAYIKSSVSDDNGDPLLSFSAFAVVGKRQNIVHTNVRYRPSLIDRKDVEAISHGVFFALKEIPVTCTVGQAVQAIRNFQQHWS
jgi:hypothetical protein